MRELSDQFEKLIAKMFSELGYHVSKNVHSEHYTGEIDIIASGQKKYYVEVKYYRSSKIHSGLIRSAAIDLKIKTDYFPDATPLLITNNNIPPLLIEEIRRNSNVEVWDRSILFSELANLSIDLKDQFELLLLDAQQGIDSYISFSGSDVASAISNKIPNLSSRDKFFVEQRVKSGRVLISELNHIGLGRNDWMAYETLALKILRYLFDKDLTLWEKQSRTDDTLSRFDLICRINAFDDYWRALITSFNTRFVLFEFKNYTEQITQHQIYTTERYLYEKALRSVGFIISRKGGNSGAVQAAKGALKENGKLILLLSDQDLVKMLELKDNNENPNDYLSNKLDEWLISLSR